VDAGEGDGQQRVAERPEADVADRELALAARKEQIAGGATERKDALSTAILAGPEKAAGRPQLEAAEPSELNLERPLDSAHELRLRRPLDPGHLDLNVYARPVRGRLALFVSILAALVLAAPTGGLAASAPPPVGARALIVADENGEILLQKNADRRRPMASITKLMTALVTLEHARPRDVVTVRGRAPAVGESTINLRSGERIAVRDLLAAALVQSANDAAYALAAHVGDGSVKRFVRLMNEKAVELGLTETHYVRPDGLDTAGHYSSAADTLALARVAMADPLIRRLVRKRSARIAGGRTLHTWNDLLGRFRGTIGVKTGHTNLAGWSQVAAVRRDETVLYVVALGSRTRGQRNDDLIELFDWGFSHYGRVGVLQADRAYASAAVPFSEERLRLVVAEDTSLAVRLGRPLLRRVVAPATVELPVEKGEKLGEVVITDGTRELARQPLVASKAIDDPSFGRRVGWYAGRAVDEAEEMLAAVLPGI
jgi:D-alanyl-D-alanine carboxypeptidase (penicillin-binding protein 5/6)